LYLDYNVAMVEVVLRVPSDLSSNQVRETFIGMVNAAGLEGTEMTLKKFPGSVHWHLHQPGKKGTLEATWWPSERRFWFSIHENRRADWQDGILKVMELMFSI
jgi:hypothetical protein